MMLLCCMPWHTHHVQSHPTCSCVVHICRRQQLVHLLHSSSWHQQHCAGLHRRTSDPPPGRLPAHQPPSLVAGPLQPRVCLASAAAHWHHPKRHTHPGGLPTVKIGPLHCTYLSVGILEQCIKTCTLDNTMFCVHEGALALLFAV